MVALVYIEMPLNYFQIILGASILISFSSGVNKL